MPRPRRTVDAFEVTKDARERNAIHTGRLERRRAPLPAELERLGPAAVQHDLPCLRRQPLPRRVDVEAEGIADRLEVRHRQRAVDQLAFVGEHRQGTLAQRLAGVG